MKIDRVISEMLDSNMYIIRENGRAIIVDPCITDEKIENIDYILLTHEHFDHISGVNYWKDKSSAMVIASEVCAEKCKDPKKNLSRYFETFCEIQTWIENYVPPKVEEYSADVDITFVNSYEMKWEGHTIIIKECPGHSLGSSLIILDDRVIFSGDTIFENFKTECGFPGGSRKGWKEKGFPLIESLDGKFVVYPGHFDMFNFEDRFKG